MLALIVANANRRRARTALTAAGIAVGVAAVVALLALSDGLNRSAGQLIHLGRADVGLFQSGAPDPTASVLPLSLVPRLEAQSEVRAASPIQFVVSALPQDRSAIVLGIQPRGFVARFLVYTDGRGVVPGQADVGDLLAAQLHLKVGRTIELDRRAFPVHAIYHSGVQFEDSGIVVPLADAQRLAGRSADEATTIAVRFAPSVSARKGAAMLRRQFPGITVIADADEAVRAGANGQLIAKAVLLIVVLALIIGALAVANTMLAAVLERRRELVLLATIGWSPSQLAALVLGEAIAVSLLGTGAGLLLGLMAADLLPGALGLGAFISPYLGPWVFGRGAVIGVAIGVVGALYPVWRVSRIPSRAALGA